MAPGTCDSCLQHPARSSKGLESSLCHDTSPSPLCLSLRALGIQRCARVPRQVAPAEQGRPEGPTEFVGAVKEVAVQGITLMHRRKQQVE
jgi:hypothetical protein